MEGIISILKAWQLHPLADHFTVVLLTTAVVADLVALLFSTRLWLRYMALSLMIAGAIAAALSYLTGGLEAQRLGEAVTGPAKEVLTRHAWFGEYLMYAFIVLALWRIGLQAFNFLASSRSTFLILALIAISFLFWETHLGSDLLYTYGVGTQLMAAAMGPTATPSETPGLPLTPMTSPTPAVSVVHETPNATPTPVTNPPLPAPSAAEQSPTPTPSRTPSGAATGASL
jgi:uncharacterized membrane protein